MLRAKLEQKAQAIMADKMQRKKGKEAGKRSVHQVTPPEFIKYIEATHSQPYFAVIQTQQFTVPDGIKERI